MTSLSASTQAPLHVAFGVDASYFRGMGVAIVSLLKNNPGKSFVFHVFAFSVPDDARVRIEHLAQQYALDIRVHVLSAHQLDKFRAFPCFSKHHLGTFIRLLIPGALQGVAHEVLYLDADLLCLGPLDGLADIDLSGYIAAAVHDQIETTAKTQIAALGLMHAEYFNAGVMFINVDEWMAHGVQDRALTELSTHDMTFADQDALNIALNGRVRFIDERWNSRYHLVEHLSHGRITLDVPRPVTFVHFTGPVKPWHSWCLHESRDIFVGYQNSSTWRDMPLDDPHSARDLKLYSRFLFKQGYALRGLGWHLKYLIKRAFF